MLLAPVTPLRVISVGAKPVIAWLNVKVSDWVVDVGEPPFWITLLKVTVGA